MEIQFTSSLVLLAFLSVVFALLKIGKATKFDNRRTNLPPGPWKLPILGSIHHLISSKFIHHTLADLAKKHGPLMHLQLGQVSVAILSSPEIVKEAFKTHDLIFSNRSTTVNEEILSYGLSGMGFSPYGSAWRHNRKICVQKLLGANRIKSFQPLMVEEVSNLISSISSSVGTPINLTNMVYSLTSRIFLGVAFGKKYRNHERILSSMNRRLEHLAVSNFFDLFPSLAFLDVFTGSMSKARSIHKNMDQILEEIMEEHQSRKVIRNDTQQELEDNEEEDLVNVLLSLQEGGDLEIKDLKAIILDLFSGAKQTEANTIINVMSELVKNPRVMEKARAEVRKALAGYKKPEKSVFGKLSYLRCVIKETFRLHPTAPFLILRQSRERCEINGYTIPAKTQLMVNGWAMGRDSTHWEDAQTFYPERFDGSSVDLKGANFELIPFGTGRRICPGMPYAMKVMELVLVRLLYNFNWELPNGFKAGYLDMAEPLVGIASRRKYDLLLSAIPYDPLQE